MKQSGIYKIKSKIKPERIYIGSSINITRRWSQHLSVLRRNIHRSSKLQRHYNKYGINDLEFSILEKCTKEDLIKTEQMFLDFHKPYFNTSTIAGSWISPKCRKASKIKLTELFLGSKRTDKQKNISKITRINNIRRNLNEILVKYGYDTIPLEEYPID